MRVIQRFALVVQVARTQGGLRAHEGLVIKAIAANCDNLPAKRRQGLGLNRRNADLVILVCVCRFAREAIPGGVGEGD